MFRLSADSQAAYDRFIKRVVKNKLVWIVVMVEHDYPFYCEAHDKETDVFPVWSDRAYANQHLKKFDFETELDTIGLDNFIDVTLPSMIKNGFLVGPNWDANLTGKEVEPNEMLERLKDAMK